MSPEGSELQVGADMGMCICTLPPLGWQSSCSGRWWYKLEVASALRQRVCNTSRRSVRFVLYYVSFVLGRLVWLCDVQVTHAVKTENGFVACVAVLVSWMVGFVGVHHCSHDC